MSRSARSAGERETPTPQPSVWQSAALWLAGVLVAGTGLRIAACVVLSGNLANDRDIYLALADGIAEGRGYSSSGSTEPTAFRPPLYPLLLALPGLRTPGGVALLNVLLGIVTILLTERLARAVGLSRGLAVFAAGLVAVDPLLVNYTTQPMTEVLCADLVTALLLAVSSRAQGRASSWLKPVAIGVLFGLSVLCRPTVWVFGALAAGWWCWRCVVSMRSEPAEPRGSRVRSAGVLITAAAAVIAPWLIRNVLVMGEPILTTTHGGYTLLLGNNASFHREVVDQPLGTVWDGSHGPGQEAWAAAVNEELERQGLKSEVERDRWMSQAAWSWIVDNPAPFLRACLLRFIRFWNVVPSGPAEQQAPGIVRGAVAVYYVAVLGAALIGLWPAMRFNAAVWMSLLLLIASFSAVHLLYWSNARMRAPVMPAVAVLAAGAFARRRARPSEPVALM